jgi:hypothetical protein
LRYKQIDSGLAVYVPDLLSEYVVIHGKKIGHKPFGAIQTILILIRGIVPATSVWLVQPRIMEIYSRWTSLHG